MSETLIGVLIGGVIGVIAQVVTLVFNYLHWKRDAKLAHLRAERTRFEQLFKKTLARLGKTMQKNSYPSEMMADIYVLMPKEISELLRNFMKEKDITLGNSQKTYLLIAEGVRNSV